MAIKIFQKKKCPNCGGDSFEIVDKKYFITVLLRCKSCFLMHRHPKESLQWEKNFYQNKYKIDQKLMTELPSDNQINILKKNNFKSLRSLVYIINPIFKDNNKNKKVLDYGCSWGYNVFKLSNYGYESIGFEISKPRAEFGENKLQVKIFSELNEVPPGQDIILSTHVIEHLIDLPSFFKFSKSIIKENGVFIALCPNGNMEYKEREPETWHGSWGDLHVNLLDFEFAKYVFKKNPFLILSGDWIFNSLEIQNWDGISQQTGFKKDGKELLIIAKPNINLY